MNVDAPLDAEAHARRVAKEVADMSARQLVGHLRHLAWNEAHCPGWNPVVGEALRRAELERREELEAHLSKDRRTNGNP